MGADSRAFQEILGYNCSSVHCSSFEFTFCDYNDKHFASKKRKKKKH